MKLQVSQSGASLVEQPVNRIEFRWRSWAKPLIFLVAALVVVGSCLHFKAYLTPAALAEHVERWQVWTDVHPFITPLLMFGAFVVLTGLFSIPAVITLSVLSGWLLGIWEGLLVVSFAETAGASVAFLISRYLLRDTVTKGWPQLLAKADELIDRDGAFYVLSLRLVHVVPSWIINLVLGCTTISLRTFWWTTQLGMLPSTVLYVVFGAHLPSLAQIKEHGVHSIATPEIIFVFVVLAMLPLVARKVMLGRHNEAK